MHKFITVFFFFQAEDGIRDADVTGVQTCALPIWDWDRHPDQWRWARFDQGDLHVWRPIPRDRDQAFSRLDGVLPGLARYYFPDLVGFGDRYPALVGLTWDGRALDRRVPGGPRETG